MRTKLSRKLLLSTGSIIVVLLSVAFLILERSQAQAWNDYLYTQSLAFARLATPELLKRFRGTFPPEASEEVAAMAESLALNRDLIQFSLVSPSGRRLYQSPAFAAFADLDLGAVATAELGDRVASGRSSVRTHKLPGNRRVLDLLEPAYGPSGQQVLSVRYLISYDSVDARVADFRLRFLATAGAAVLLCVVLVGLAARRIMQPIESLTGAARAIADGDLAIRIPPAGRDEIGTLAETFNDMAASLARSQDELTGKNAALRRANDDLRDMQEQLLRSERLAAIGQLAAGVSHEIDNPVGIILGLAELLLEETPAGDPRRDDLLAIVAECRRCKRITGGLLGFARPVQAQRDRVDLRVLVEDTLASLRPQKLFRDLVVECDLVADGNEVTGDPDQLRQVLVNLLLNAAQAMKGRGRLAVALKRTGEEVELAVDDSGPGIPAGDLEAVFQPFVTTKGPGEGTGLGLALCRKLVEAHGGSIHAEASRLGGARLCVRLPAAGGEK
ncbi:MAG: HAMP domain-containing protein [Deltaproteobacteria bacterium]|nr:MAG: HAMP domain-containing protein [Deltaproteobacteria bacterium]